jgi:hypothetical protein
MPSRKENKGNKERELIEKLEPSLEEEKEDSAEQINIEDEPNESKRPK